MKYLLGATLKQLDGPILVTGHTGFKGTWLTLLLEKMDIPVVGMSLEADEDSLFNRMSRKSAIPEVIGDIRDKGLVDKTFHKYSPSAVIHLAAQPLVSESYLNPVETFETNVMGTVNILDSAGKNSNTKSIIAVTTDKVYKNVETGLDFVETDPLCGKDPYSASKVGSESAIAAWQQIFQVYGGPIIVSVRSGNVIGGGDWSENRLLPDLVRGFVKSEMVEIRNPESTRPWQHVLDPLLGYLLALEEALTGSSEQAFNFGPSEKSISVKKVAQISAEEWGKSVGLNISGETQNANTEAKFLNLDSSRAREKLSWAPLWSQEEAIRHTILWWKKVLIEKVSAEEACEHDLSRLFQI